MVDKGEGQAPQHHRALQATLQSPHDYPNDHFRPILIWLVDVFGSQYFVDSVSPAQAVTFHFVNIFIKSRTTSGRGM